MTQFPAHGCRVGALEAAGWEFLVEHAAETTGITGLRDSDDGDT